MSTQLRQLIVFIRPKAFRFIFLILIVYLPILSLSQNTTFKPGYIIFQTGDSISGLYAEQYFGNNEMSILYKHIDGDSLVEFSPKDISAYGSGINLLMQSFDIPMPRKFGDTIYTRVFLRCLVKGKTSLWEFKDPELNSVFFIERSNGDITLLHREDDKYPFPQYVIFPREIEPTEPTFRKVLAKTFNDCSTLGDDINNVDLRRKDLINAVIDYHNCTDASFLLFEREKAVLPKPQFGLKLGVQLPVSTFPTADRIRFGREASIFYKQIIPRSRNQYALQIELGFVESWAMAKQRDRKYLNPVDFSHITPSFQRIFYQKNYSLFINAGVSFPFKFRNLQLIEPQFSDGSTPVWEGGAKRYFFGLGVHKKLNGIYFELESRIHVQKFTALQFFLNIGF